MLRDLAHGTLARVTDSYDVLIVGLGAMGSAAAYHLARRGLRVLGLDQFNPPHTYGSSHGETRVIREAYFEHPVYVPLVQRAYELWDQLARESGQELYLKTGGIMIGRPDSTVVKGAIHSARKHRLPHEILSAEQVELRAPGLRPDDDMTGILEPRAGILFPERCIAAHLDLARRAGAAMRPNERVLDWQSNSRQATIRTESGTFAGRHLIFTAGPWIAQLVPTLKSRVEIERQVLLWFKTGHAAPWGPDQLPIHLWEYEPEKMFYGFPDLGDGLKLAFHHQGEVTDPDSADRNLRADDVQRMRDLMARFLPRVAGAELLRGTVCLYTNTPDGHFILDRHPDHSNVILGSPCSGHGFKFASAIGEVLADLVQEKPPICDLSLFQIERLRV